MKTEYVTYKWPCSAMTQPSGIGDYPHQSAKCPSTGTRLRYTSEKARSLATVHGDTGGVVVDLGIMVMRSDPQSVYHNSMTRHWEDESRKAVGSAASRRRGRPIEAELPGRTGPIAGALGCHSQQARPQSGRRASFATIHTRQGARADTWGYRTFGVPHGRRQEFRGPRLVQRSSMTSQGLPQNCR